MNAAISPIHCPPSVYSFFATPEVTELDVLDFFAFSNVKKKPKNLHSGILHQSLPSPLRRRSVFTCFHGS